MSSAISSKQAPPRRKVSASSDGLQQAQRGCAAKRILLGVAGELLRQALCHAERRQRPEYARMHSGGGEPRGHGRREEQLQVEAVPVLCGRLGGEAHQRVQLGLGGPVHQLHRRGAGGDRGHPVDLGPIGEHRQAEAQPPRGGLQAFDHRAGDGIGAVAGAIHLAAAQSAQPARGHLVRRRRPGQQRHVSRDIAGRPPADLGVKAERPGAHAQVGDNGAAGQIAFAAVWDRAPPAPDGPDPARRGSSDRPPRCASPARCAVTARARRNRAGGRAARGSARATRPAPVPVLQGETPPRCRLRLHQPDYSSAPPAWGSYPASLARNERGILPAFLPAVARVTEVCRVPHPGPGGAWLPAAG